MLFKKMLFLILTFWLTNQLFAQIDYKGFPQWSWHKEDSTEYYLYTPSNMKPGEKYPIALFMHGCCGDSYHATLRNTVDPPIRMWHNFGANTQSIPTYLIAPATSRGWRQHFENLKKVIDELVAHHNGDPQRIYVCGFSMGGEGTFGIIQQYPGYFAAAIPMGMSFRGDSTIIKDIPIWANQGKTDWWARFLKSTVAGMRRLNGAQADTGSVYETGVNPRYSSFEGIDHGVQWIAASKQDLTGWAYSKINDGNKYPTVFFKSPSYNLPVKEGETVTVDVTATDSDGSIAKTEILVNGVLYKTFSRQPFTCSLKLLPGDNKIEARATDNKGKKSLATTIVKVEVKTKIFSTELPYGRAGALYIAKLQALGNGAITYTITNGHLPKGCRLITNGWIKGIPVETGMFKIGVTAKDEDGDDFTKTLTLLVKEKRNGEIIIRNAITDSGTNCDISKITKGETLFTGVGDDEISFSETGNYDGLTLIKPPASDTARHEQDYLSFETDENAIVFIGYEKKDRLLQSGTPSWLHEFSNQPSPQIAAQYYYYDVYAKKFPKGKVILPGADERKNNAGTNYFVLIKSDKTAFISLPEINTTTLSNATTGRPYHEWITALYGTGKLEWKIIRGTLAPGLNLSIDGSISGSPQKKGIYSFTIEVKDEKGRKASTVLSLLVN